MTIFRAVALCSVKASPSSIIMVILQVLYPRRRSRSSISHVHWAGWGFRAYSTVRWIVARLLGWR